MKRYLQPRWIVFPRPLVGPSQMEARPQWKGDEAQTLVKRGTSVLSFHRADDSRNDAKSTFQETTNVNEGNIIPIHVPTAVCR